MVILGAACAGKYCGYCDGYTFDGWYAADSTEANVYGKVVKIKIKNKTSEVIGK